MIYTIEWHRQHDDGGPRQAIKADNPEEARQKADTLLEKLRKRGWTYMLVDAQGRQV